MIFMYRLTKPQQLIYNMEKYVGGPVAVICGSFVKKGTGEPDALKRALNELFRVNAALRTRIVETVDGTMQTITDFEERDVEVLRFASKAEMEVYAADYTKKPVDIHGESLAEIHPVILPEHYGFIIKVHHLIGDAWSLSLIASQFCEIVDGKTPLAFPYEEYTAKEVAYLQSVRCGKDRAFFLEQFRKCEEATYLSEKQADSFAAVRKSFSIDAERARRIYHYAKSHGTSPFMLFMAALAVYMNRVKMNVEKFYIGTAVLNRSGVHEKNTAGMFINIVPILMELDNEKSFSENLSGIQKTILAVFRHQKYNYGDVLADIRKEYGFTERLCDVTLSYQNATIADGVGESIWYHNGVQAESLQIHIDDRDIEGIFKLQYDYQKEKFTAEEIDGLHVHLCNLLFDAIESDRKKPYELELLSKSEKEALLHTFNDTAADYPKDKCVHMLFEKQATRTLDKTAVIACDKMLTYRELNESANRIAHSLIEKGVGVGDIVAFALPRKSYLIAAMFGILKAGAAYLPIDTSYPRERIDYMMADSGAKLCITEETVAELLANESVENPNVAVSGKDLCYCVYTSGTTGKPKGTLISHCNVENFVQKNEANQFQTDLIQNCEAVICCNAISFDIVLQEIFLPLSHGLSVVMLSDEQIYNIQYAEGVLSGTNYGLIITPTKLELYMQDETFCQQTMKKFSVIMCGAETLSLSLLHKIKQYTETTVFNGYGPTETTCGVLYSHIEDEDITIGKPIANTQIYIVDKYLRPVPVGAIGELCIAGDGVGAGYLNRPELTAEKFVDNPFGEGKLYKSGDLAYWRQDGHIVYVGRNDFQVKIRGLRIELGEIENAISTVDGVSQAVAVVRKDDGGRQLICAFYTGAELPAKEIRAAIGHKLPKYMLPHIFTHLRELPLTPSGKVNRKALPEVDLSQAFDASEYVAPEGDAETRLASLMEKVLRYAPVGRDDDFFDLGGDSLSAIEFVSLAHNEGIYFALQNVFDYPTVRQLAACITQSTKQTASLSEADFTKVNEILAKNTREAVVSVPEAASMGNLLLAGATGFLGVHILADYLDHDEGTAYCLVRGKDQADSEARLRETLRFYFSGRYDDTKRLRVVCADLEKENFGLSVKERDDLATHIDTTVNAAGSVKHYGSYKYFYATNVEMVKRLIAFCTEINAKLIHISTMSVSGNSMGDQFDGYVSETEKHFYESSLYIGQSLENVYVRSKFEAERHVLEAMGRGLRGNIMRMGNLTNRASDGKFQRNHETNAFLKRVKAFLTMKVMPDYLQDMYVEFTPVDAAASAVMTIVRHFSTEQTVFHINSTKVIYMERLLPCLEALGYPIKIVTGGEFTLILKDTIKQDKTAFLFETFINDMNSDDKLVYDSNIRIENRFTEEYLKRLGFEWPEIGMEYLRKYVDWFRGIGYFQTITTKQETGPRR